MGPSVDTVSVYTIWRWLCKWVSTTFEYGLRSLIAGAVTDGRTKD